MKFRVWDKEKKQMFYDAQKTIFCVIGRFLYNPIYAGRNSIYGASVFPFWIYIKYFGKPVYKKARKLGANTYFSLMAANILGSLAHVRFFINGTASTILWFIGSLILCSGILFGIHRLNAILLRIMRKY